MICVIDHQKQTRSQGGGIPCRRRYVLVPDDPRQACRNQSPITAGSLFCGSNRIGPMLSNLPGSVGRLGARFGGRPFPFSLRGGSLPARAKATVLFPSRQMSSRHNSRGGPVGVRFAGAPHTRLYLNSAHHIACKLADVPESHRSFSCAASSMDRTCTTRRPSNWVIQTIRSDRK